MSRVAAKAEMLLLDLCGGMRSECLFFIMFCFNQFFSSSDDQLEDSDSDEHSRSESVTGMERLLSLFGISKGWWCPG